MSCAVVGIRINAVARGGCTLVEAQRQNLVLSPEPVLHNKSSNMYNSGILVLRTLTYRGGFGQWVYIKSVIGVIKPDEIVE